MFLFLNIHFSYYVLKAGNKPHPAVNVAKSLLKLQHICEKYGICMYSYVYECTVWVYVCLCICINVYQFASYAFRYYLVITLSVHIYANLCGCHLSLFMTKNPCKNKWPVLTVTVASDWESGG